MTRRSSSVTIRDVARQADVSVATVSRYINRNAPVSTEVAERLNQVMIELVGSKWLAACAMEAKNTNEAKENWQKASAKIRISKEYSQRLLETLQAKSQESLNLPETALSASGTEILFAEGADKVGIRIDAQVILANFEPPEFRFHDLL